MLVVVEGEGKVERNRSRCVLDEDLNAGERERERALDNKDMSTSTE